MTKVAFGRNAAVDTHEPRLVGARYSTREPSRVFIGARLLGPDHYFYGRSWTSLEAGKMYKGTLSLTHLTREPTKEAAAGSPPPLLLLLHGVGSNERDLMGL